MDEYTQNDLTSKVGVVQEEDSYPAEEPTMGATGCISSRITVPALKHYLGEDAERIIDAKLQKIFFPHEAPQGGNFSRSNMTASRSAITTLASELSGGTRAPRVVSIHRYASASDDEPSPAALSRASSSIARMNVHG